MAKVTILQPAGLGDILFCQKIAYKLIEHGHQVYWPVDRYSWINEYIKKEGLSWSTSSEPTLQLVLKHSIESNHPYDIMTCKYDMIGKTLNHLDDELHSIDWTDWVDYLKIERNTEKEEKLFYEVLGLNDGDKYILINKMYGLNQYRGDVGKSIIDKSLRVIELGFIGGFTLFDWCKVIENATEIHTVDTSINYVIETLELKSNNLCLYPRHPDHILKCLGNLFKKNWCWIG